MEKKLSILCALFLLFSVNIQAQDATTITGNRFKVGLGLEAALAVGNFGNAYTIGGGLTLRFLYKITPELDFTFTTGGIVFVPKSINKFDKASVNIPFKLGGMYMFTDKFYGIMEVGTTHSIAYYEDVNNNLAHVSRNSFTYAPGIGVILGSSFSVLS